MYLDTRNYVRVTLMPEKKSGLRPSSRLERAGVRRPERSS